MPAVLRSFILIAAYAIPVAFMPVDEGVTSVSADDVAVYNTVLASWLGKETPHQLVDLNLSAAPSPATFGADCVKGIDFAPADSAAGKRETLTGVHFDRPGIELIDGTKWHAVDPQQGIAAGKSVDDAVRDGFANSLMSFSQIRFSRDRMDALVSYGTVCGGLCGFGATVHLHREAASWKIANRCSEWVS